MEGPVTAEAMLLSMGLQGVGGDAQNTELSSPSILKGCGVAPSGAEIKAEPGCSTRHEGAGLPVQGTRSPAAASTMLLFMTAGVPHLLPAPPKALSQRTVFKRSRVRVPLNASSLSHRSSFLRCCRACSGPRLSWVPSLSPVTPLCRPVCCRHALYCVPASVPRVPRCPSLLF